MIEKVHVTPKGEIRYFVKRSLSFYRDLPPIIGCLISR